MTIRRFNEQDSLFGAGNSGTSKTLDFNNSKRQKLTLTDNCTITLSNPVANETYLLTLLQDGTGSRVITWPAAVKWPSGIAPTLSGASKTDLVQLEYDGTSYYGTYSLDY